MSLRPSYGQRLRINRHAAGALAIVSRIKRSTDRHSKIGERPRWVVGVDGETVFGELVADSRARVQEESETEIGPELESGGCAPLERRFEVGPCRPVP